jgi:hypothetical protein
MRLKSTTTSITVPRPNEGAQREREIRQDSREGASSGYRTARDFDPVK